MTTTTKTADFVGRALVTPDTDARDYVNRGIMAGDRDYMGRPLTGGSEEPDAGALLDEAAVRFDYSQYDDIDDMVDVNGGWGPMIHTTPNSLPSMAFTADGLEVSSGEGQSVFFKMADVEGPMVFGTTGTTVVEVADVSISGAESHTVTTMRLDGDVDNSQEPSLITSTTVSAGGGWELEHYLEDITFNQIADLSPNLAMNTPLPVTGRVISIVVVDVAAGEMRATTVTSAGREDVAVSFDEPPTYVSEARAVFFCSIRGAVDGSIGTQVKTLIENDAWGRPFTEAEVDALVTHFTA